MILLSLNPDEAIMASIAGAIIGLLILGAVIATAVQVNRRNRLQRLTIEILCRLAEIQGVSKEEIRSVIAESQK